MNIVLRLSCALLVATLCASAATASNVGMVRRGDWTLYYPPAEYADDKPFMIEQHPLRRGAYPGPVTLRISHWAHEVSITVQGCTERFDHEGFTPIKIDLTSIPDPERRLAYLSAVRFLIELGKAACPVAAASMKFKIDDPQTYLSYFGNGAKIPEELELRLGE